MDNFPEELPSNLLFASTVAGHLVTDPYFDAAKGLRACYLNNTQKTSENYWRFSHRAMAHFSYEPDQGKYLVERLLDIISRFGFKRIAYKNHGGHSITFATEPNQRGEKLALVISPTYNQYVPHPAIIPPLALGMAEGHKYNLAVRVMPFLDTKSVTEEDVKTLQNIMQKSGLAEIKDEGGDSEIRENNIGILHYKKQDGTSVRLPYILDWGTMALDPNSNLQDLHYMWRKTPELAPYYEAQEYLTRKAESLPYFVAQPPGRVASIPVQIDRSILTNEPDMVRRGWLLKLHVDHSLTSAELLAIKHSADALLQKHPDLAIRLDGFYQAAKFYIEGRNRTKSFSIGHPGPIPANIDTSRLSGPSVETINAMIQHDPDSTNFAHRIQRLKNQPRENAPPQSPFL